MELRTCVKDEKTTMSALCQICDDEKYINKEHEMSYWTYSLNAAERYHVMELRTCVEAEKSTISGLGRIRGDEN